MTKYYGIGLGRTGTSSLCKAFQKMGFKSKHYMMSFNMSRIRGYDFVNDAPIPSHFEVLDEKFKGAKFIYTVRELDAWLISMEKHLARKKRITGRKKAARIRIYGSHTFDRKIFTEAYKKHDKKVKEYFRERPQDLLIMNICNGDGWEKLIPFVGEDNIVNKNFDYRSCHFPHSNKAK